jgi:imidazolonepropionase-like amidohydrolase
MRKFLAFTIALFVSVAVSAQPISKKESEAINKLLEEVSANYKPQVYLIRNVSILTMTDSVLLRNQDVLIDKGKIQRIGVGIANQSATVIDGTGKFLMPGLTDMHVHLMDKHPMKNTWLLLLLVNGVTTVRDLLGEPEKLLLREKIRKNEILGPNLYQSGPIINSVKGNYGLFMEATMPEQGRQLVIEHKKAGYDGLKVYDGLSQEVYTAIVDEAAKQNIIVDGHLPWKVPLSMAIQSKQNSVEHLGGYFEWKDRQVSTEAQRNAVALTAGSTLWNCPTIYNHYLNLSRQGAANMLNYAETTGLIPSGLREAWKKRADNYSKEVVEMVDNHGASSFQALRDIVLKLHMANGRLIAGTDAGSMPFLIPGYSLHEELKLMARIGIPIYDVLKMTTINAAQALQRDQEFGTIEQGKRADLLLLNANPLLDVSNLQQRAGIMVRGVWLPAVNVNEISGKIKLAFGK